MKGYENSTSANKALLANGNNGISRQLTRLSTKLKTYTRNSALISSVLVYLVRPCLDPSLTYFYENLISLSLTPRVGDTYGLQSISSVR